MSAICHAASIAIAQLKAAGRVSDQVAALLARIEELEAQADETALETARLHNIEDVALTAYHYHMRGYIDSGQDFDVDVMLDHMEALGAALGKPA